MVFCLRVILGVDGVMCWQVSLLVFSGDWGLFGVCWSMLLVMNQSKYFWRR